MEGCHFADFYTLNPIENPTICNPYDNWTIRIALHIFAEPGFLVESDEGDLAILRFLDDSDQYIRK